MKEVSKEKVEDNKFYKKSELIAINNELLNIVRTDEEAIEFYKSLDKIEGLKISYADDTIDKITITSSAKYILEDLKEEVEMIELVIESCFNALVEVPIEFAKNYSDYGKSMTVMGTEAGNVLFKADDKFDKLRKIYNRNQFKVETKKNMEIEINMGDIISNTIQNSANVTFSQKNNNSDTKIENYIIEHKIKDIEIDKLISEFEKLNFENYEGLENLLKGFKEEINTSSDKESVLRKFIDTLNSWKIIPLAADMSTIISKFLGNQ